MLNWCLSFMLRLQELRRVSAKTRRLYADSVRPGAGLSPYLGRLIDEGLGGHDGDLSGGEAAG